MVSRGSMISFMKQVNGTKWQLSFLFMFTMLLWLNFFVADNISSVNDRILRIEERASFVNVHTADNISSLNDHILCIEERVSSMNEEMNKNISITLRMSFVIICWNMFMIICFMLYDKLKSIVAVISSTGSMMVSRASRISFTKQVNGTKWQLLFWFLQVLLLLMFTMLLLFNFFVADNISSVNDCILRIEEHASSVNAHTDISSLSEWSHHLYWRTCIFYEWRNEQNHLHHMIKNELRNLLEYFYGNKLWHNDPCDSLK